MLNVWGLTPDELKKEFEKRSGGAGPWEVMVKNHISMDYFEDNDTWYASYKARGAEHGFRCHDRSPTNALRMVFIEARIAHDKEKEARPRRGRKRKSQKV